MLVFEMRIWNPYGMEGVENGVAVYGGDGMVQIGKWDRPGVTRSSTTRAKLVEHEQSQGEDEGHIRNFVDCVRSRKRRMRRSKSDLNRWPTATWPTSWRAPGRTVRYDAQS